MIRSGDSFNTRRNSRRKTGQLKNILATATVMNVGRIPCSMVPRNVAHVPSSDTLAVGSKGKVRITNSATSNETIPPQSHNLPALLEGPDRTPPASAIELTFARTPPSVGSIQR